MNRKQQKLRDQAEAFCWGIIWATAILILLTGCAHEDPWTARDTVGQSITSAVIITDGWSSRNIGDDPYWEEGGYLARKAIGANPSSEDFTYYMAGVVICSYFIARALPAEWRPVWWVFEVAIHGAAVKNNCDKGLC